MAQRKAATVVEAPKNQPYAEVLGQGRRAYRVRVYYFDSYWDMWRYDEKIVSGENRAERIARKRLAKHQEQFEHEQYRKTIL